MKSRSHNWRFSPFASRGRIVAGALLLATPSLGVAQVIQIGPGGGVTTYDGPAVFTGAGAEPIAPPAVARAGAEAFGSEPAALGLAAEAALLSPDLIAAVAWRESRFRPRLVSRAGAVGEMQLMPATARAYGADASDTGQNYRAGAAYLQALMRRYDGDLVRALAAYNAGPAAVDRYGGVPPYRETQAYVAAVLERLSVYAENGSGTGR